VADFPAGPTTRGARLVLGGGALMLGGGVFGAVAGAVILGAAVALRTHLLTVNAVVIGAGMGAIIGGIIAPVGSLIFLRRVPLGLAIPGITLGTVIGLAVGAYVRNRFSGVDASLIGAAIGVIAATVILRVRTSSEPAERPPAE
jgi:hypothetical protein